MNKIVITKENKGQLILDWLKNIDIEYYYKGNKIEKDIEIQNILENEIIEISYN